MRVPATTPRSRSRRRCGAAAGRGQGHDLGRLTRPDRRQPPHRARFGRLLDRHHRDVGGDHWRQHHVLGVGLRCAAAAACARGGARACRAPARRRRSARRRRRARLRGGRSRPSWSGVELGERDALVRRQLAARRRDRIAVRVVARVAERGGQRRGLLFAGAMLAPFGVRVPLAGVEPGLVGEVALPQPVNADDSQRLTPPVGGEAQGPVVVVEQIEAAEAIDELGGGAAGEAKGPGQAFERHRALRGTRRPRCASTRLRPRRDRRPAARVASATPIRRRARETATARTRTTSTRTREMTGEGMLRFGRPGSTPQVGILNSQNYQSASHEKSR